MGKPTGSNEVRGTVFNYFTTFYKVTSSQIIIIAGIWDNRRNPGDLHKNVKLQWQYPNQKQLL